jgi:serine beta-lactamase-like protein LACTB, mitochondrial
MDSREDARTRKGSSMICNHFRPPRVAAAAGCTGCFDMWRSRRGALVTLIFFVLADFAPFRVSAQSPQLSPQRQAALEGAISKFIAANKIPGLSVAVVEDHHLVWSKGFGVANLEDNVPATSQTLYRLASVSKPLTATAAMQLWERGKLDLDAPIQKYCPAFPPKPQTITTRELLGHLGGIRHFKSDSPDDPEIGNTKYFDDPIAAGIKFFADDPLVAPPGSHFHYSTYGYTLVGCVIEGASGQKYVDYMRENIFLPARMSSVQVDDHYTIIPHRTGFYGKLNSGAVVNAAPVDSSYRIPGGGWLSSAEDMGRFEVAILDDHLIKSSTRDIMWTEQKPSDGSKDDYALGWGVGQDAGVATVGHDGDEQGTSTAFLIARAQGDGVVVLINLEEVDATALTIDLLKILLATQPAALNH